MRRVVRAFCLALTIAAAIPAAVFAGLLWCVYRLSDRMMSLTGDGNR